MAWPPIGGMRAAGRAIALLCALGVTGFALWWVLARPRAAQVEAAGARVEAATSAGTAGASRDAMKITLDVVAQRAAIAAITEENERAIQSAAGAAEPIGPDLARAARAALCMRDAYRADPGCAAVRGSGESVGVPGTDAGSGAAGQ